MINYVCNKQDGNLEVDEEDFNLTHFTSRLVL